MPTSLENTVTVMYGDLGAASSGPTLYVWPVETELVHVDIRPVYDQAQRAVIYTLHSYTFRWLIARDIDQNLEDIQGETLRIRQILTRPAGGFVLKGAGFGDIVVNLRPPASVAGNTGQRDVVWGPKPQLLSYDQLGTDGAAKVTWRVEIAVTDQCSSTAAAKFGQPMEYVWEMSFSIGTDGLTKRVYWGHLRIPQYRLGYTDRTLKDISDAYRDQIYPPLLPGFRRTPGEFRISDDKATINFTVTDEELTGPAPPPGVVEIRASHQVTAKGKVWPTWFGTLEAEYELLTNQARQLAYTYFKRWAESRISTTKARAGGKAVYVPLSFTAREPEAHGKRQAAFTLHYRYTIDDAALIKNAIFVSALWLDPGTDWKSWSDSMVKNSAWDSRGMAQLSLDTGSDLVVDLCLKKTAPIPAKSSSGFSVTGKYDAIPDIGKPPAPGSSWLDYWLEILIKVYDDTMLLKPLPADKEDLVGDGTKLYYDATNGWQDDYQKAPVHIIQRRAAPRIEVLMRGYAERASYAITPPRLVSLAGANAIPYNANAEDSFRTSIVANVGIPVIRATWNQRYLLDRLPTSGIKPPHYPVAVSPSGQGNGSLTFMP